MNKPLREDEGIMNKLQLQKEGTNNDPEGYKAFLFFFKHYNSY